MLFGHMLSALEELHMGPEHAREKKIAHGNFFGFCTESEEKV